MLGRQSLQRLGLRALSVVGFAGAAYWLFVALKSIVLLGWRHPMLDQFRLYPLFLNLPFPDNVLQLENGHRPVLPNLIRLLEIQALGANQMLQLGIGTALAVLVALMPGWLGWRRDRESAVGVAVATLFGVLAVFWMANARILLHGNESLHAYMTISFALLAFAFSYHGAEHRRTLSMGLAILFALCASLSFGPGLAAFGLLLIGAVVAGNRRHLGVHLLACAAFAFAYLNLFPRGDHVSAVIELAPGTVLALPLRWLASPWVYLGLGAEPALGLPNFSQALSQTWLAPLAGRIGTPFGLSLISAIAVLVTLWFTWRTSRRAEARTALALLGLAFAWFGIGASLLVSVARAHYFSEHPEQLVADRYLLWPCFFWLGLGLQLLALCRHRPWMQTLLLAAAFAIGLQMNTAAVETQRWALSAFALNQRIGIAMLLDLDWPELSTSDAAAPREDRLETARLFRDFRLGIFQTGIGRALDTRLTPMSPLPSVDTELPELVLYTFRTVQDAKRGAVRDLFARAPMPTADLLVLGSPTQGVCGALAATYSVDKIQSIRKLSPTPRLGLEGLSYCRSKGSLYLYDWQQGQWRPVLKTTLPP